MGLDWFTLKMIHKQELHGTHYSLPKNAKILSAQYQGKQVYFWYYFDPKLQQANTTETYHFQVIGTGWDADLTNFTHLATLQENFYVWHVFYRLMSET